MKKLSADKKAGLYITIIVHLAALIILLAAGLDFSLKNDSGILLDFSRQDEVERMAEQIEQLRKEAELKQAVSEKLQRELGNYSLPRNVAVDRASLKDDRGTDASKLYADAKRLQEELNGGFSAPDEVAEPETREKKKDSVKKSEYSGPSVVSYLLEGRKASKLPIPAYRCLGAGEVTVLIQVNNAGYVTGAKIDEGCSSPDGCLRAFAIRAARLSRFSSSASAASSQKGNIVYSFIAQ